MKDKKCIRNIQQQSDTLKLIFNSDSVEILMNKKELCFKLIRNEINKS